MIMARKEKRQRGLGRLYKRTVDGQEVPASSKRGGIYWLEHRLKDSNGKVTRIREALKDDDGNPITDLKTAEAKQLSIMAPFITDNRIEQLKFIKVKLQDLEQTKAEADKKNISDVKISDGWIVYRKSPIRPDSGPATLINYERHFKQFQRWLNDHYKTAEFLSQITTEIASEYACDLDASGISRNTYNKHTGFLKLFFRVLQDEKKVGHNPFIQLRRKKLVDSHSRRPLTVEQIYKILSTSEGELALLLGLGYFTGLRRGDCCTLKWNEVDLPGRLISRIPNKIKDRSAKPEPVKLGINKHLFNALNNTPTAKRIGFVLPTMAKYYLDNKRDRINRMIKDHFQRCGIQTIQEGTGPQTIIDENGKTKRVAGSRAVVEFGFHSLRYSYISHHAEAGTAQALIQVNAGHKNPAMTEHYTRISDDTARRIADVLDIVALDPEHPAVLAPISDEIRNELEKMNDDNWQTIRDKLLARGVSQS